MAILPKFGPGKPAVVAPIEGGIKDTPRWVWYAGGAVIGIAIIMFLRRGSSSSASGTLATNPTVGSDQGQLDNLSAAVGALAAQINNKPVSSPAPAAPAPTVMTNPLVSAPAPAPSTAPKAIAALQIHPGDTPQSLTAYWTQHGFPGFTAQNLIDSNANIPFVPGNTWYIYHA